MKSLIQFIAKLHNDDRGAEGLEKLLIIGAIALPLLGLLILFRNSISEWVSGIWGTVKSDSETGMPTNVP